MDTPKTPARAAFPWHLVVPALTIGLAALALLTFAAPHPVFGVTISGGPTEYPGEQTVRVQCLREEVGVVDGVALEGVRVEIGGTDTTVACGAGGAVEVPVRLGAGRPSAGVHLRVTQVGGPTHPRARQVVLAEGEAAITGDAWRARAVRRSSRIERATFRGLRGRGLVPSGAVILGKDNKLYFQVEDGPEELRCAPGVVRAQGDTAPSAADSSPLLDVSGEGADVSLSRGAGAAAGGGEVAGVAEGAANGCGPRGFVLSVRPTFVTASVSIRSHRSPAEVFWEAPIPVVSAPWIEGRALDEHHVLRGKARSLAVVPGFHARLEDERGRRVARYFPATPDGRGGSWADVVLDLRAMLAEEPLPRFQGEKAAFLIVSTDDAGGTSTSSTASRVTLPYLDRSIDHRALDMADDTADVILGAALPWIDGLAPAAKLEAARTRDARGRVMVLVFAGALLEAVLVFRRARRSAAHFRAHLAAASDIDDTAPGAESERAEAPALDVHKLEDHSRLSGAFLAIAVIVFGFAILAVVVASRIG